MKLFCKKCGKPFPVKNDDVSDIKCPDCGTEALRPEQFPGPGAVVGDFLIEKAISSGGMGVVFAARQLSLDRPVALKVLLGEYTQDREYVDSLFREARAAAKINHPNIVQAYAVGEDQGVFYFAMELVSGNTMKSIIAKEGILPFERSAKVICDIAHGLDVAWREQKLVHQDIKPDNIMMDETRGLAKLADLGLAKTGAAESIDAGEDEVFGTPQYISPEQLTGVPTDVRSDIYSLGATFFQFLTGRFPYVAPNVEEMAKMHDAGNLEPPQSVNPDVPDELNRIVLKMMARNLDDRYQSPELLIKDLENFLQTYRADGKRKGKTFPVKKVLKITGISAGVFIVLAGIATGILLIWGRYGNLPEALKPAGDALFGNLIEHPQEEVAEAVVPEVVESRYSKAVSRVLGNFKSLEAVDAQWSVLSNPENSGDAELLAKNIGAFAVADEARCDEARKVLRQEFITRRNQLRIDEENRVRNIAEEENRRRLAQEQAKRDAERKLKEHLTDLQRQIKGSLQKCMIAICDGNDAKFDEDLAEAKRCKDDLVIRDENGADGALKREFAEILSALPREVVKLKEQLVKIGKIDSADGISFRRERQIYIVQKITSDGKIVCINNDDIQEIFDFEKLSDAEKKDILSGIGKNGGFYFDIFRHRMPERADAPAGFWQKFMKLAK